MSHIQWKLSNVIYWWQFIIIIIILTYYAREQNYTGYLEGTSLSLNKTIWLVHKIVQRSKVRFITKFGQNNQLPEMMMEHRINLNSLLLLFQLQMKQNFFMYIHLH